MKQRPDPSERDNGGSLFSAERLGPPPVTRLFSPSDPETSRKAAVKAVQSGELGKAQTVAVTFVRRNPGSTTKELARVAASAYGGQNGPEWWRQRIGRRLNELERAGLIHRKGERDGCSLWWPGPNKEQEGR